MNFELANIDPYKCSLEELEKEINRLDNIKDVYLTTEQAFKVFTNSIYGAIGAVFFPYYNTAIAEAITLQGQNLSKYASSIIDEYFKELWVNDTELHKKLGLTYANKPLIDTITIYMDTDSVYVVMDQIIRSCDYKGDLIDFILDIKKYRLNDYLKNKFEEYAKRFNTKNIQDLELEKISYSTLMMAKKKYVLDLAWKDSGVRYKPQEKIKPVGIELIQGSTPTFVRKVLKDLLKLLLEKNKDLQYSDVVKKLKKYKLEFTLQNPDDISKSQTLGDYEKYVLNDQREIKLADKCPINNRAAAIYNNKVLNSKWKTKYPLIKTGDKMKFYYTTDKNEVFGFLPNNWPIEFGPQIDFDMQFEKVIIEPFNRFMEAIGMARIPGNLVYCKSLF